MTKWAQKDKGYKSKRKIKNVDNGNWIKSEKIPNDNFKNMSEHN